MEALKDIMTEMKELCEDGSLAEDGFDKVTNNTNVDVDLLRIDWEFLNRLALWRQVMSAVWTKADRSVVCSFDSW